MGFKDLLLILDAETACDARLALAVALAKTHGASVTALCLCGPPAPTVAESYALGEEAVGAVVAHREAEAALAAGPLAARVRQSLDENAVSGSWETASFLTPPNDLALRARARDLAIVGREGDGRVFAKEIVLASGAPCLVTCEATRRGTSLDRVLVAWDGSRPARRALQDALPLLSKAKAVQVASVGRQGHELPAHLGSGEVLAHLQRHGIEATFETVDPGRHDIGSALLGEAERFGADLLVLGAYGHSPTAEVLLGGVTRTVLARAELPVFLSH